MKKNTYFLFSCLMHLMLLLSFLSLSPALLKQQNFQRAFPAFIYQGSFKKIDQPLAKKGIIKESSSVKASRGVIPRAQYEQVEKKEIDQALLTLLHQAIAEKQIYPESATELNQTGRVVIEFLLLPSGVVSGVIVARSSGVASLDSAALEAVQKISPVAGTRDYLKDKRWMSVEVVFK